MLRLSTRILEDFPDEIPEFTREGGLAGWTYLIQQSLLEYLRN